VGVGRCCEGSTLGMDELEERFGQGEDVWSAIGDLGSRCVQHGHRLAQTSSCCDKENLEGEVAT